VSSRKLTAKELAGITSANIDQVYSGKQGCMCGCLGKYFENPNRMVNKVLNILKADDRLMLQDGFILYIDFPRAQRDERNYVAYMHTSEKLPLETPTE
jgi:hypothetical protein